MGNGHDVKNSGLTYSSSLSSSSDGRAWSGSSSCFLLRVVMAAFVGDFNGFLVMAMRQSEMGGRSWMQLEMRGEVGAARCRPSFCRRLGRRATLRQRRKGSAAVTGQSEHGWRAESTGTEYAQGA